MTCSLPSSCYRVWYDVLPLETTFNSKLWNLTVSFWLCNVLLRILSGSLEPVVSEMMPIPLGLSRGLTVIIHVQSMLYWLITCKRHSLLLRIVLSEKLALRVVIFPLLKNIISLIQSEYDLRISYQKAWRAREASLNEIRWSLEDSYKMIQSFAHMLNLKNQVYLSYLVYIILMVIYHKYHGLYFIYSYTFFIYSGSITKYKIDDDGRFWYFFMALLACISGWQHCCPVVSVDGT